MVSPNVTELIDGANVAEWFLIVNNWSDGFLFGGILLILALIVFTISKNSGTDDIKAALGTCAAMFLISFAGWFVRWNGYQLVSTFMVVLFLTLAGLAALLVFFNSKFGSNN